MDPRSELEAHPGEEALGGGLLHWLASRPREAVAASGMQGRDEAGGFSIAGLAVEGRGV
jgi:hypothetical protein